MSALEMVLIAAAVVYVIAKRFAGAPVGAKSVVLPLVLAGYGLVHIVGTGNRGLGAVAVTLLAVEALVSVGAGVARAATIKLYVRDGHLWQRYTVVTLGVWIALIALRVGFIAAGSALGAALPSAGTLMFTFGLSMVVESLVVSVRATATGAAIKPRQSRRRSVNARY
jgi:hypothetical protein